VSTAVHSAEVIASPGGIHGDSKGSVVSRRRDPDDTVIGLLFLLPYLILWGLFAVLPIG